MMCALIEDLLPPSYFSSTLLGVQTDQRVLRQLIVQYLPALDRLLQEHDIGGGRKKLNQTPTGCKLEQCFEIDPTQPVCVTGQFVFPFFGAVVI